ncbi:AraC family transcriptional regulator [bacterium SCSIO 12741]|nr:AraC family transcriptional regulator [bacterium SCSIO 12741]
MSEFYTIKSLTELFKFMELPGPKHPLIAFMDFSDKPFVKAVPDYKYICDFYQISFKNDEHGSLKYGRETYDYQEGSLVYLAPEQVIEYSFDDEVRADQGWVLFFHSDLLKAFDLDRKMKDFHFFSYQSNEALHISEKERTIIESILKKIQWELDSNIDEFSEEVIVSNLELLLNYSKRFYNRQFITRKRFSQDVVVRFTQLLEGYFEEGYQRSQGLPTVQYFADNLNYSSNYLNELIRKSTSKSILEHVHYTLIERAKGQLLNSDKSVSEIAFDLGFEYSQYFSRLFKKKTGLTPVQFRKAS